MTVLEFMRCFSPMASQRSYALEVRKNPGDGTSKRVHSGPMGEELYMSREVGESDVWVWFISKKDYRIIVVIR